MDTKLYIKLVSQVERQTPEAAALEADAASLQPGIDSAQVWLDSCQATVDAAQAAFTEASAVEDADTSAQKEALDAANATLETAKTDLAKAKTPQDEKLAHARQIRSSIAQCQDAITASGVTMAQVEIEEAKAAEVREAAWERIKVYRDWLKEQGISTAGKWFHSDKSSRIQQLGLVLMGANVPAGLQWKTMDGTFITMTPQLASQIFQATALSDMTMHAVAEQHKANLYASSNPQAYNWMSGWPAVFA